MRNGTEFWQTVQVLLAEGNLQQKDIANKLGVASSLISQWKIRGTIPTIKYIGDIAELFGCTIDDLLVGEPKYSAPEPKCLTVPYLEQKLSCGPGEDWSSEVVQTPINILPSLAAGHPEDRLVAATVRGDSMIGANLYDGDMVVFCRGLISGNGIYAIALNGDVYVKRLAWNPLTRVLTIISDNPAYEPIVVKEDDERIMVLGKVTGWLHTER